VVASQATCIGGVIAPQRATAMRAVIPDEKIDVTRVGAAKDFCEVGRWGFGGGEGLVAGLDGDGAVAACRPDEFLDAPAGSVLDPVRDGYRGEYDAQVGLDGVAGAVVDRPSLQIVLGHPKGLLDAPELVVGVDDEGGGLGDEVGGVAPSTRPGRGSWPPTRG